MSRKRIVILGAAGRDFHGLHAAFRNELEAEVLDGPQSIVFDQAENRLHTEKALLLTLLDPKEAP